MKRYRIDDLLRWCALGACRIEFGGGDLVLERPGYKRPTTPELTDDERAMLAEVDAKLLAQRPCPVPARTAEDWFAEYAERHAHESPATRVWVLLRIRRDRVRYGIRRLRIGHEWWWQRRLELVRAETAAALRQLGHAGLARWIEAAATRVTTVRPARRPSAVQMELRL
jgi:hypothetical protein